MKRRKILTKKTEEELLNTNEVMSDYLFHIQMFVEQKKMDFENISESNESSV